ncbi:hypothetical protein B566_EDAN013936 [Ephemera danica]|nr:hypothetical protein B566_EDAN013936 [Ephemera danica]
MIPRTLDHFEFLAVWFRAANEKDSVMRIWCVLLVAVTSAASADPDLRQLLHIWRPTLALTWSHVTPECAQSMASFSLALSQRQQWASSMLDATGQSGSQYLQGSDFWFGSRPQCEQVNNDVVPSVTFNESSSYPVAVYRVLKLKVNVSEPLVAPQIVDQMVWFKQRFIYLGICLPGACGDAAQVSALLRQMLDAAEDESNFRDVQLVKVKILPSELSVWGETSTSLLMCIKVHDDCVLCSTERPLFVQSILQISRNISCRSWNKSAHYDMDNFRTSLHVCVRLWRLIVPYAFTILIVSFAFRKLNAESIYDSQLPEVHSCPKNGWRNLLFINNFYHASEGCVTWGWYLANDMQLYILGLVILLVYVNGYRRTAITAGILVMVAACFTNAFLAYNIVETYPKTSQMDRFYEYLYAKPWFHLGSVWMGMLVGWSVYRGIAFNVGKVGVILGWTLCLCGTSIPLFTDKYKDSSPSAVTAVYLALKSTIWGACLAWILLVCIHKRSNFVRKFLELPFVLIIGFMLVSFATGLVMSLIFESPVIRLLALLRESRDEKYQPAMTGPEMELENHRNVRAEL